MYFVNRRFSSATYNVFRLLNQVATSVKGSGAALDIVDACSLLFRLEMEGGC